MASYLEVAIVAYDSKYGYIPNEIMIELKCLEDNSSFNYVKRVSEYAQHEIEKLQKQNEELVELVEDIIRCVDYCTEEANENYLPYWKEKLKQIKGG